MNNLTSYKRKKPTKTLILVGFITICFTAGGERGIRTPGPVTVNSFQDCRIRPLCHFSSLLPSLLIASANIEPFLTSKNFFSKKNKLFFIFLFPAHPPQSLQLHKILILSLLLNNATLLNRKMTGIKKKF